MRDTYYYYQKLYGGYYHRSYGRGAHSDIQICLRSLTSGTLIKAMNTFPEMFNYKRGSEIIGSINIHICKHIEETKIVTKGSQKERTDGFTTESYQAFEEKNASFM